MTFLLLALGFFLLTVGAEALVRGASGIAASAGIRPLVIGLTVVAFGTSAPEFAISVGAALDGQTDIALGNVVGSNVLNVLLILGIAALIAPLVVSSQLVRVDVPLMIGATLVVLLFALDGSIGRLDGAILFAGLLFYVAFQIRQGRREQATDSDRAGAAEGAPGGRRWPMQAALVAGGMVLLVAGAQVLVTSSVELARSFGVSELVIGLTLVAIGSSLPELATSVLASFRGERDIAVGNAVGSNLFNLLGVLGLAALVAPQGIAVSPEALRFDLPVMLAVAVACLPIFTTGHVIDRWEGVLFLGYYAAYLVYVLMAAMEHASLDAYSTAMSWFVLPLTAVTLAVLFWHHIRRNGS